MHSVSDPGIAKLRRCRLAGREEAGATRGMERRFTLFYAGLPVAFANNAGNTDG